MPAHASWRTCLAGSSLLLGLGCEPSVSARAVWIDGVVDEDSQTIHVYDQGELREFELVSAGESIERMQLDAHGRGVLVRAGLQRAAWIDLADSRRLPILLTNLRGQVEFATDGSALLWLEFDAKTSIGNLRLLPVAPGLPLERTDQGGVQPLGRPAGANSWWVTASDAPIAFVAETEDEAEGERVGLWSWPSDRGDPMLVRELASDVRSGTPPDAHRSARCAAAAYCIARVAIEPAGEVAVFSDDDLMGDWQRFDVRAPEYDAPLVFPSALDELIANAGIGLIHLLDRDRSLWLSSGLLHWWNQRTGELRSLPVLGEPDYFVLAIDRGHGVLFMSATGPVLRADRDGLRPMSLVTTPCIQPSYPVVSPTGGWIAWSCVEAFTEFEAAQEAIVRVSALGLERYGGVSMTPLAIDDEGHLLLTSDDNVASDVLDGTVSDPEAIPRNLYVLSREGVLTRIDELEPAPVAVPIGNDLAAYIQAAAL